MGTTGAAVDGAAPVGLGVGVGFVAGAVGVGVGVGVGTALLLTGPGGSAVVGGLVGFGVGFGVGLGVGFGLGLGVGLLDGDGAWLGGAARGVAGTPGALRLPLCHANATYPPSGTFSDPAPSDE